MKLLMISTDRNMFRRGSAVAIRQLEMAQGWEEVHIIVFTDRSFEEASHPPNVWVYPTRSRSRYLYPFDAIKLGKFIIRGRGITHITTEDSSLTAMAGVALKRKFQIPLEINVHTDIGAKHYTRTFENKVRKAMSLSYLRHADKIRVVSERIKSYIVNSVGVDQSVITVRPIPVDVEKIKSTPALVNLHLKYTYFSKIVLVASRFESEKNVELAIAAWPKVLAQAPETGLVIVGDGREKEKLEAMVSDLGLAASVKFEGWADTQTLISYYKTADVFLNTSWYEGYGMTLVEAQAAGTPIVSTDVGVAREVGAVIADWNADDVAQKIVYSVSGQGGQAATS